eukprot:TRINITY_DN11165_c0_g1_i1.p1 TRINITY_DN11165_c0_g1~~TRINITY_DN11165_c0_g1_i1.p1  ORF type:complete len:122 (-),score=0.91 TRINITY_DN11165_c0_g1_i1:6-371(-)
MLATLSSSSDPDWPGIKCTFQNTLANSRHLNEESPVASLDVPNESISLCHFCSLRSCFAKKLMLAAIVNSGSHFGEFVVSSFGLQYQPTVVFCYKKVPTDCFFLRICHLSSCQLELVALCG